MLFQLAELEIRIHQLNARTFLSLDEAKEQLDVALLRHSPLYIAGLQGDKQLTPHDQNSVQVLAMVDEPGER